MADAQQLRHMIEYNRWANERLLAVIDGLSPEELDRPREAYFGSIARNLHHIVMAQWRWLARWQAEPLPADRPLGPWREAFASVHDALARFVAPLSDADFDRIVTFTTAAGVNGEHPLGRLVAHLVNHGSAHRAETGLLLERLRRSPGDLDYLIFLQQTAR